MRMIQKDNINTGQLLCFCTLEAQLCNILLKQRLLNALGTPYVKALPWEGAVILGKRQQFATLRNASPSPVTFRKRQPSETDGFRTHKDKQWNLKLSVTGELSHNFDWIDLELKLGKLRKAGQVRGRQTAGMTLVQIWTAKSVWCGGSLVSYCTTTARWYKSLVHTCRIFSPFSTAAMPVIFI